MYELAPAPASNTSILDTFINNPKPKDAQRQSLSAIWMWRFWFLALMGFSAVAGVLMWRNGPSASSIAWILYLIGLVIILLKPRYGLYLVVFLTLVGDPTLTSWYPFVKNFSSRESLLYLHDAVIISPLETYIVLMLISWLGRGVMQRKLYFFSGRLFLPALMFAGFILFGLFWGMARGGNLNIALWESRAIFYMPVMLVLTSNLLEEKGQISTLLWFAMLAIFGEGLIGNHYYFFVIDNDLSSVDSIAAHAAAIHINTFFVLLATSYLFRASLAKRLSLPMMLPFVALTFMVMKRRAGFLTLGIALVLLVIILFQENRRLFYGIMPVLTVTAVIYIGIFWNSSGALGLPAQAIKSVFATDQAAAEDRSSDIYRVLENINIDFTIHQVPLTGVGFGKPFYILVEMPDISFFTFWEYITHNSIVWIWMKVGFGGFFALIALIGWSLISGLEVFQRLLDPDLKAVMMTAVLYVVMHFTYAYVDMSWDIESMIYLGCMLGIINGMERIASRPKIALTKRYPWSPEPNVLPDILPLETVSAPNEVA